ncbi:MAG: hypothetical protein HKN03_13690 [Acidimicrobiales bacterium]|nr:hypothetical protein [Acidimicrobiales bacterium]
MTDEQPRQRPIYLLLAPLLIVVALGFALQQFQGGGEILSRLTSASPALLAICVVSLLLYWWITVSSWSLIARIGANAKMPISASLAQIVTVNLGKYVPGKIWGIVARGTLMTKYGATARGIMNASVLEQFYLLFTALCVGTFSWGLSRAGVLRGVLVVASMALAAAGVLAPRVFLSAWNRTLHKLRPGTAISTIAPPTFSEGAALIGRYILIWISLGVFFAGLTVAITDIERSLSTLGLLVFTNTTAYVGGFVALFAPGGLGVRESIGAGLLASSLGLEEAAFVMVAYRILIMISELIAAALAIPRFAEVLRG